MNRKGLVQLIGTALALTLPLTLAAAPAKKETRRGPSKLYTIEQFMATTNVMGASFSPDEKEILFSSNETGIFNVYSVPATGGKAKALTTSTTDSTYAVSYFPKDRRLLFTRDQGGNENNHLYVRLTDGTERDLTPGEKLKASFGGWSKDKNAFYLLINDRDPRFFDMYRISTDDLQQRTLLYRDETGYEFGAISDDEKWIAFEKPNTTSDSNIYLFNTTSKEMKHITPHEGVASYSPGDFHPNSKWLYFLTNDGSEFTKVRRYELASGKSEDVESAEWDIWYSYFSENGRYRVTGINKDASTVIRLHDTSSGSQLALPRLPNGDVTSVVISPSETKMALYVTGDRNPRNLYLHDFKTAKTARLTDTLSKDIDAQDLIDAQIIRFKSFDGLQIPGVLYKPHQASSSNKAPAILMVHGGPGGQARKGYSSLVQFLVNHGYLVLDINNRGSSGYGKTFYMADDRKHGREPLWDCVEAKSYLASLPYVDGSRVGIMGGSYGGYMVAAALAFKPEVFDVGVDIFGVTNWVRTLQSIPPYWESFKKALYDEIGDPATDLERLKEISPLFHAARIKRPLLVVQGKNDPRVIKAESDEIVEAVRKNNVPVEYLVFDDEGHGFSKKKNQIAAYSTILKFLDTHLKSKQPMTAAR